MFHVKHKTLCFTKNQIQHHHLAPNHKKIFQTTRSSNQCTNKHCKTITHQQTKKQQQLQQIFYWSFKKTTDHNKHRLKHYKKNVFSLNKLTFCFT